MNKKQFESSLVIYEPRVTVYPPSIGEILMKSISAIIAVTGLVRIKIYLKEGKTQDV